MYETDISTIGQLDGNITNISDNNVSSIPHPTSFQVTSEWIK